MSGAPSPIPPPESTSSSTAPGVDWRLSVQQSYRNVQVREIATVLAALEPGATTSSSKLRLAMQFEDAVFKQATSLADYRKRLTKRLKKVQKSYVPSTTPSSATTEATKVHVLQQLRATYGDQLLYILKHADAAVQQMKHKQGPDKAAQLKQHIDGVQSWANDLGLTPLDGSTVQPTNATSLSESDVTTLKALLERRTENIRSHVVKLADPDRFLLETMEKIERDVSERGSTILSEACQLRYQQLSRTTHPVDGSAMLQMALEKLHQSVPPPTRNQRNDTPAALIHLDKMRASCSLVLAWSLVPDKTVLPSRNLLAKAHGTVNDGIEFVAKVMAEFRKAQGRKGVTLEDAWMKVLRPPEQEGGGTPSLWRPVLRSRVLLKPGRKVPSNLLHALQRKRAFLIRPPPNGEGSHLRLDFDEAFTMTIYLVPLLVTLRAQKAPTEPRTMAGGSASPEDDDGTQGAGVGCATLTPLSFGLSEPRWTTVDAGDATTAAATTAAPAAPPEWRVWGATGTSETLGRVVEERLRDASARATFVLRQCFAATAKGTTIASDFEVELLEATTLLEFIQLARTTYIPDWQDDDV